MPKVLIGPTTLANIDGSFLTVLTQAGFEPVFPPIVKQLVESEVMEQLAGLPASLAGSEPYTRRVMAAHPQLKVIARAGVGYDAVDLQAATDHGIAVTYAPGTNQEAVAEHALALILALAKNVVPFHMDTKACKWPRQANLPVRGKTLGIVGLGRIGKAVVPRAASFGMRILASEIAPDHDFIARHKITLVPQDRLFAESDFVSLHVPLTPATKYLINKNTLATMKPTSYLVNTSRGGVVCEVDLIQALKSCRIAGAALDVFEEEPPPPSELFKLANLIVTPHVAGVDQQSRLDMAESAARAIVDLSRGLWPAEKVVNPEVRTKFRW